MKNITVWNPEDQGLYGPAVVQTLEVLNRANHEDVINSLPKVRTAENGVQYAVFADGSADESEPKVGDEALFVFNAFAQPLSYDRPLGVSNLLRGQFLYELLKNAKITNQSGDTLPIVMFASPHLGHNLGLSRQEKQTIAGGEFLPLADRYLKVFPEVGKLSIFGHSQGANAAVELAKISKNTDLVAVGMADPVHENRKLLDLIKRQLSSNPGGDYKKSGYRSLLKVHQLDDLSTKAARDNRRWERIKRDAKGILDKVASPNVAVMVGLTKPKFVSKLEQAVIANPNARFVVGRGGTSLITSESLDQAVAGIIERHPQANLEEVIIAETGHGWAENVRILGQFTLKTIANTADQKIQ